MTRHWNNGGDVQPTADLIGGRPHASLFTVPGALEIRVLSGAFDVTQAWIFGYIGDTPGKLRWSASKH
jgi:hypothetical protein